jgi:hypothetical protein
MSTTIFFQSSNWVRILGLDVWPKNDSMDDRSTSPLEEQVFGIIPLFL